MAEIINLNSNEIWGFDSYNIEIKINNPKF